MLTSTSLKKVLISALAAIACIGFVPVTPVQAQDDCGWVTDWNNPDGGYCSYHPEWYGGTTKSTASSNAGSTYSSSNDGYAAPKSFTVYYQYSNPYEVIGNGNMRSNGCVPTAAAMLGSYYGDRMGYLRLRFARQCAAVWRNRCDSCVLRRRNPCNADDRV